MSEVIFNPSNSPTVGVEVEAQIVDKTTGDLVNIAENIVNGFNDEDRVKHELYLSTVEITSSPALDTNKTYEELSSIFKKVLDLANNNNAGLIATGTHPFALYEDQVITNVNPRYEEFAQKYGWAVRRLLTFGMHVHVGMDSKEKAVAVHDEIRKYLPLVLALSACSPFWRGKDTELYCSRLSVFQGLPNTGLPEPYLEWSEYEQSLKTLVAADVIKEKIGYRQVWKDVRIHPAYGTVEVRIADSMPSLIDTVAVATFVQALAIKIGDDWEEGNLDEPTPNWLIERNRWAAIKEGLNAKFIIDLEGRTKPIKEVIKNLTKEIKPIAESLGSLNRLNELENIFKSDNMVENMRNFHKKETLDQLVKELQKILNESLDNPMSEL
ncbi:YbdK family carboxylate-amine ligase [Acidimicrobiaceae bacterium]|nr:YbdK family carboxylate-amine ligase [Acidimicrobiaceae bacterium]